MEHRFTTKGERDVVELEKRNDGHAVALRRGGRKVKGGGLRSLRQGTQSRLARLGDGGDGKPSKQVQAVQIAVQNGMVANPSAHPQIASQQLRQTLRGREIRGQINRFG